MIERNLLFSQMFYFFISLSLALKNRNSNIRSKLSYAECFNFARNLEDEINNDVSIDELKKKAKEYCTQIPDKVRQDFCTSLSQDKQFNEMYNMIKNQNMNPESVCAKMGYSRGFGSAKLVTEEQCSNFIDLLKEELKNNKPIDDPKIKNKNFKRNMNKFHTANRFSVNKVCKKVSENEKMACQIVTRIAYKTLLDDILAGADSTRVCHRLQDLRKIQIAKDET